MPVTGTHRAHVETGVSRPLAVGRIGVLGGLTGILSCVGPTTGALLGVISAQTAFVWANDTNTSTRATSGGSGWPGSSCVWLLLIAAVAVGTYAGLYALTTWLGTFT